MWTVASGSVSSYVANLNPGGVDVNVPAANTSVMFSSLLPCSPYSVKLTVKYGKEQVKDYGPVNGSTQAVAPGDLNKPSITPDNSQQVTITFNDTSFEKSNCGKYIYVATILNIPPFAAPNLFVAGTITNTSVKLTWQALPQNSTTVNGATLAGYQINYLAVGGTNIPIDNILPANTSRLLDGLFPCTSYSATIRGFSNQQSNQNGLYTNPITFTTLPSADTGTLTVSNSSVTANQALISVTETSTNRSACGVYLFQYVVESSNGQSVATYKSPLNTQRVSNLQPSTRYTVKVSVMESTSGSAGSIASTSFTTEALPKIVIPSPNSIAATSTTGSAITLVWVTPQPPSSITITGYEVSYTGPDGTPKTAKVATTIQLTTITDLKPCTIYSIAVKTVGAENDGKEIQSEFSTPSQVQTAVGSNFVDKFLHSISL
ncbi:hypothetical protein Ciccas_010877 [Cichlidogyrus casuarinus]|uniref:Fibronectin type-III domain-containing protein n=1 Tax=Cichlidogyrus casuarinus TaxID=1844966 RepID=A0ABD2PVS4_9PLAT